MSNGLEFTPEISKIVEAGYMLPDVVLRRAAVLRKLAPRTGEKAVDIGCGPGFLTADLAAAVGPGG